MFMKNKGKDFERRNDFWTLARPPKLNTQFLSIIIQTLMNLSNDKILITHKGKLVSNVFVVSGFDALSKGQKVVIEVPVIKESVKVSEIENRAVD